MQSQDCLRKLEIGTQFRDSESALRNLEIAQIPKLRRTNCTPIGELCLILCDYGSMANKRSLSVSRNLCRDKPELSRYA